MASLLTLAPVIPVVVLDDEHAAVPLARALVAGGLPVIEITMRTRSALPGIKRIAQEVPEAVIGAGTVLTPADVRAAVGAGARFLVSPGSTERLLDAMLDSGVPILPGAATASEVLALLERGLTQVKLFPAQPAGGVAALKALAGPLPTVGFCPTGGITATSAPDFLALPNVACVGGSWLTPADAVAAGAWAHVEQLARQAAALRDTEPLTAQQSIWQG
jgi:2-dehydro-3-deoxyphosphogluconate aldolase/(4S)-4-hydroxy-2-oxoglutarate aldolase